MANPVEDFLTKFHSLEGLTIANRRKNFFTLLRNNASLLKSDNELLNEVSINLNPTTFLEQLFQVEFLMYFRRRNELLYLLKEGNDVFVSKIVKQTWFFKEAFNEIEANELVNEVLPSMSFSVRMKVLRKLSRYLCSENFEKVFDAIVKRYGIFIASQFITGCGPSKIREVLSEYPIKLTSTQLRILHGKDPELIDYYFTHSNVSISSSISITSSMYKNFVKFIFNNDRNLFDYLDEKYRFSIKLGRRATKKFVVVKKNEIIQNPSKFSDLNMKAVIRKIGKESVQLFRNTLPQKLVRLNTYDWIFRSFPKRYNYSLCITIFQAHYNIKLVDYPELFNESILNLISDNSERAILAKVKVDKGDDDYLKYLAIEDSIRLIKEKINLTSDISERAKLIKHLIQSCHINKDLNGLLLVMKYFCFRHKNDELNVHLQFINNIENLFGFKKFTEEMWTCLNELLTIHMLKFDHSSTTHEKVQTLPLLSINVGTSDYQKLSYLEFLFKMGQSIDGLILEFFSVRGSFPEYGNFDKQFGKYFIFFLIKHLDKLAHLEVDEESFGCRMISEIDKWNACNKDDQLSFYDFPMLVNSFNYSIRNHKSVQGHISKKFRSKIFTTIPNPYRNEYMEIYWNRNKCYGRLSDVKWFLKYDPLTFLNHFEFIFTNYLIGESDDVSPSLLRFLYTLKKFSHIHVDEKTVQLCLDRLGDNNCTDKKTKFVPCLSMLMKPEQFVAFADSYKPANKKLDLSIETEVRLYTLQCAIARNFKNTKSYEVLYSLLNYCAGDYFKYAMRSLYSILYRTPENMLPQYLNFLSKKAVSVRKHALFLTCELSTCTKVENMIKVLNKQEQVQSLQKHMFSTSIQYFVKNPTDQFFELVKLNMLYISKADDESLNIITDKFCEIPKKYQAQYIQYAWVFLEKTVDIWAKLSPLKNNLLRVVSAELISQIPLEFGMRIIDEHFITHNERDLGSIQGFIFDFLTVREEKSAIFEKVFTILDKCKDKKTVFQCFHSWYVKIMGRHYGNLKYWEPFYNYFRNKITIMEHFRDYVKLFFLKVKIQSDDVGVDDLAHKLIVFYEELFSKYSFYIAHLFAKEMQSNLAYFASTDYKLQKFYYSMIKNHPVPNVAFLVLSVISVPSLWQSNFEFNRILHIINGINDVGVQINLKCKFNEYLLSEEFLSVDVDMQE